ncbi:Gp37 family protein [Ralstonia syzygii]|uniref:Gp37 family protein n=1 Tax=Ralstonia syzygii TaxID=28097 RepID=UPI0027E00342|nr:Gp37 family protein [Ralstonia syzygii]
MATTLHIIDALVARLKAKLPQLAVEYFPDKPADYRLNHPKGALLVSFTWVASSTRPSTSRTSPSRAPLSCRSRSFCASSTVAAARSTWWTTCAGR